jgi:hypothetical protein
MLIMQRKESRSFKKHISRNIIVGNMLSLPVVLNDLRRFQTIGFRVGRVTLGHVSLQSLKKVSPVSSIFVKTRFTEVA